MFISYARESSAHCREVRRLCELLRENGVDAWIDEYDTHVRQDWVDWMAKKVQRSDYVLVIASPAYRALSDGDLSAEVYRGIRTEWKLIKERVHADGDDGLVSVLPVLLPGHPIGEIPALLQPHSASRVAVAELTRDGVDDLLRMLTGRPVHPAPPLGARVPPSPEHGATVTVPVPTWPRRAWLPAIAGLVTFVAGLLLATSPDVRVPGLVAVGAGLALQAHGFRARPRADDRSVLALRARALLEEIVTTESRTLQRLLGDTGDPQPADVRFLPSLVRWRPDNTTATAGSLSTIGRYYQDLDPERLLILGAPGAGKTVLAIQLVLDLAADSLATGRDQAVPLRLSLSAFAVPDADTSPVDIRARLDTWIAEHLTNVYGVKPATAQALVKGDWIIPVLDGLDEIDPDDGPPLKARRVLSALNVTLGRVKWRGVLTCRTARHNKIIEGDETDPDYALQHVRAVTVQPLEAGEVVAWLTHRFPDPDAEDGIQARWRPVAAALREDPNGDLARCLTSPLRLYLAVTVYRNPATLPAKMCGLDGAALENKLFSRLVPAITRDHVCPDGTRYDAPEVDRWLRTLAAHLGRMVKLGESATDFYLSDLWRTTGSPRRPGLRIRCQAALLAACAAVIPQLIGSWLVPDTRPSLSLAAGAGLFVLMTCFLIYTPTKFPGRETPQVNLRYIRTPKGRTRLFRGLRRVFFGSVTAGALLGALCGLLPLGREIMAAHHANIAVGLIGSMMAGVAIFSPLGIVPGVTLQVFGILTVPHNITSRPSDPLRQGRLGVATYVLASSLVTMAVVAIVPLILGVLTPVEALVTGSSVVLSFFMVGMSTFPLCLQHFLAVRGMARRGELPRRPDKFADWAYGAGIFRLSGTATQFRHLVVQDHFAGTPED
ncbi:TIR domain-containing protein [Amycolatopsis sp. NBC_00348]|uniref:TIR domain-containing protein n=1 Tax=Amycolatopsis sp. NBC_00348 TaxID=2975956 RepID=UPI002E260AD0